MVSKLYSLRLDDRKGYIFCISLHHFQGNLDIYGQKSESLSPFTIKRASRRDDCPCRRKFRFGAN
ncbi:hypothetical protein KC19_6G118800 [Ceratodon purpureus]|uniref:Uncharacterized protein n=1 Tax=Ceratodon purpureus TaxID=3225 RepID=A0A8T0HEY2_CERPU|nr:hypothetical protein KC19_6G118800 [Ceratodon purpureus]